MSKINPPFRADQVGRLMRPKTLCKARQHAADGEIDAAELREIEDELILRVIKQQESVGLQGITDGEFRRGFSDFDFLEQLGGVMVADTTAASFDMLGTVDYALPTIRVTDKLRHYSDIQVADFQFVQAHTSLLPKVTIPSPTMVHVHGGRAALDIDRDIYPDLDEFREDLAKCYRQEISALYNAGCRYLQLDDTNLAALGDPVVRQDVIDQGDDPMRLLHTYAELINSAIDGHPNDLTICIHLCRGNVRHPNSPTSNYEPVADVLFNALEVKAYFLEYEDDDGSDGFEPLRFVPKNKTIVLGLVSTQTPRLEKQESLIRCIQAAGQYVDLENLCISPHCGFSNTAHGNEMTEDDQWWKLELVVNTARIVWGD